jgi:4-hydroxy-3-polyprenylbenzoate decarboxylase
MKIRHLLLAITGASGAVYGLCLAKNLLAGGCSLSMIISKAGMMVIQEECGLDWSGGAAKKTAELREYFSGAIATGRTETGALPALTLYDENDLMAPVASGSAAADAMIVAPCSMGTLGRIAAGLSGNLIERAADVMLKEGKPLLLLPRETPLSAIHLENMLKLARLGVRIIPPMPGFYGHPQTVDDMINFVVGKVLDQLGIEHELYRRWGEDLARMNQVTGSEVGSR